MMKRFYILLHLFFALIYTSSSYNLFDYQEPLEKKLNQAWRWTHYSTDQGLPDNKISEFIQTPSGLIWVVTEKGFAWFDGFIWHGLSIEGMDYANAFMTHDIDDGIYYINKNKLYSIKKNGIRLLPLKYKGEELLVFEVVYYKDGQLILIAKMRKDSEFKLFKYSNNSLSIYQSPQIITKLRDSQSHLIRNSYGDIWLNVQSGLYRLKDEKWMLEIPSRYGEEIEMSYPVSDLIGNGLLSINFPECLIGLWSYDKTSKPKKIGKYRSTFAQTVYFSPTGEALISTGSGFVSIYRDGNFIDLPFPIKELTQATRFPFDKDGNLWACTDDGIYMCRLSSDKWINIQTLQESADDRVNEIIERSNGEIWAATQSGIFIIPENLKFITINKINGYSLKSMTGLAEDKSGNIWISSGGDMEGAWKWDGKNWKHYGKENGFTSGKIHKIVKDRNNDLWFLSLSDTSLNAGYGAYLLIDDIFHKVLIPGGATANRIYAFVETNDGAWWFGTYGGLFRYKNSSWTRWSSENGLKNNKIFSLAEGPDGRVWFSNFDRGIGYLENDSIKYLDDDELKDGRNYWNIKFDNYGRLWINTKHGLFSYKDGIIGRFGRIDGLNYIWAWPILFKNDRVLIGSLGSGIYILNINRTNYLPPRVYYKNVVTKERFANIQFSTFSQLGDVPPEDIKIRYKVDDGNWSRWTLIRQINLYDLPGGDHKIILQAKDRLGSFDEAGFEYEFNVPGSVYSSFEFILMLVIAIIFFIIIALIAYLYILKRKKEEEIRQVNLVLTENKKVLEMQNNTMREQNLQLTQLNIMKDKFYSIFSHDIRNPIVIIQTTSKLLLDKIQTITTEKLVHKIDMIHKSAENLNHLFDNLMRWSRSYLGNIDLNLEEIYLNNVVDEIFRLNELHANTKNIRLISKVSDEIVLTTDKNMLAAVLRNLLSNSIKFSFDYGNIEVFAALEDGYCKISVKDEGIGINDDDKSKVFNLDGKIKSFGTANEPGSGLGLLLCKEFVEKLGGRIWVESQIGMGSVFHFTIPVQN